MFWQNLLINIYWHKLNLKKLSEEDKKWLKKIAQKSDLLKNPTHSGAEVKNNTVKYGGKINGNDCKLSVNY